jgi:hypothetical protein
LNKFVYQGSDIFDSSVKEWYDNKAGFMAKVSFGPFALKRIDKIIEDPVWEAAKSLHKNDCQSDYDPTEQLPNQPHIEYLTTEFYMDPLQFQDGG